MSNRNAFLARVRQASEQGRQYRVHLQPVPPEIGYLGAEGDLCERLAVEIDAVGGEAFVVPDLQAAGRQLHALLAEAGARSAVCWKHELLDRLGVADLLATAGVSLFDYDDLVALSAAERRSKLLACDVGITSCDLAIAETGTLLMCSRPGQERLASLIAPMHIAIVERSQIVPDLIDAFEWLPAESLPPNVTLITGPSKTGDIELQLTTGVHGPGKWRVIVVNG
ncbi:MAG TPA: lactate utilization protein [Pirellulaceae bacterium]|nr:lactate utilization protein [Pirellulaceae bacterium]